MLKPKICSCRIHMNSDFVLKLICRYNCIFKFLLAVKRVHVSLHQTWKHQMCRWSSLPADDEQQALLYQIRNHMQFLVDNLQTYLQVRPQSICQRFFGCGDEFLFLFHFHVWFWILIRCCPIEQLVQLLHPPQINNEFGVYLQQVCTVGQNNIAV